jgi:hypothetical protein
MQNYRLWQDGVYGNKLRAWRSVVEWSSSGYAGLVGLRMLTGWNGLCRLDLQPHQIEEAVEKWVRLGLPRDNIMINETAPAQAAVLQGEYLNDLRQMRDGSVTWGYFLHSRERQHMREALLAHSEVTTGLRSDLMLRGAMTPASHDDWLGLLEQFPGHVLEVSIYDRCLGDQSGRNALVWEVRQY